MTMPDFSNASLDKLISLKGRTAVITGGARGIGLAIGKRLAEAGANIVIIDKDESGCMKRALSTLKSRGAKPIGFQADTRDAAALEGAEQRHVEAGDRHCFGG